MQRMVVLNKVFRQRDQSFVDILNQMRCANLSQQSIAALNKLDRAVKYEAGEGMRFSLLSVQVANFYDQNPRSCILFALKWMPLIAND